VKDGGIEQGAEALLTEAKRVDQFGFLPTELQRAKDDMLRGYEREYTERDKTESGTFVGEYVANYLSGTAMPGIEYEYPLIQRLLRRSPSPTSTRWRRADHRQEPHRHRRGARQSRACRCRPSRSCSPCSVAPRRRL